MSRIHANNFITSLNNSITAGSLSIVLTNVTGFPTIGAGVVAYLTLQNGVAIEIVQATAQSGSTITIVRAQESTAAQDFPAGATVSIRPTADSIDRKADLDSPTFIGTVVLPSTTSIGSTTSLELSYVHGVTSSIQTQLNALSSGSVVGPSSATDTAFAIFDGTTGKLIKNSNSTLSSTGIASFGSYLAIESSGIKLWSGKTTPVTTSVGCGGLVFNVGVTTGTQNTAFGYSSLRSITSGARNAAFGQLALDAIATNSDNTGCGDSSLKVVTGGSNTALGSSAGVSVSSGTNNLILGTQAATNNATGSASLTTGTDNTLIGYRSGVDTLSTVGAIAIGSNAVATKATGSTSGTNGPGIAIGSTSMPVGFRGDGSIFPGNLWRVKINGTQYMVPLKADGSTTGWDSNNNLTANNFLPGYTTTATAASTTTLTVSSSKLQYFTGSTTQTIVLPVTSTLALGFAFTIVNNSTGTLTIQSSGGDIITTLLAGTRGDFICILTSGTTASSWDYRAGYNMITSNIPYASRITVTSATVSDITHIDLTPGNWLICGNVFLNNDSSLLSVGYGWCSTTSATVLDNSNLSGFICTPATFNNISITTPALFLYVSSSTRVYLSCLNTAASGTCFACGTITAMFISE